MTLLFNITPTFNATCTPKSQSLPAYASGTIYLKSLGIEDRFERIRVGRAAKSRGVCRSPGTGKWTRVAWKASRLVKRSACYSDFDR